MRILIFIFICCIPVSSIFSQPAASKKDSVPDWIVLAKSNSTLPSNRITAIGQDNNGIIYVALGGKVWAFNGDEWKNTGKPPGWSNDKDIVKIKTDEKNSVWVINTQGQLAYFADGDWTDFKRNNKEVFSSKPITDIAFDKTGNQWITTAGRGIFRYDGTAFANIDTMMDDFPDSAFYGIAIGEDNLPWVLGAGFLMQITNDTTFSIKSRISLPFPIHATHSFFLDKSGKILIAGGSPYSPKGGGIAMYDGRTVHLYAVNSSSIASNAVNSAVMDVNGNVWVASGNISTSEFTTGNKVFYRGGIASLTEPPPGKINSSFNRFINENGNKLVFEKGLHNDEEMIILSRNVNAVFVDSKNNKWFGTDNGLFVYNEKGVLLK